MPRLVPLGLPPRPAHAFKAAGLLLLSLALAAGLHAQTPEKRTLQNTGPDENHVVVVIMGDGFLEADREAFFTNARSTFAAIAGDPSMVPCKDFINGYAIFTASNEAGTDQPFDHISRDTFYDTTFHDIADSRLLYIGTSRGSERADAVLRTFAPSYDYTAILVNTPIFGGGGGQPLVASLHSGSAEIVLHESGHSFADLADEYVDATFAPFFEPVESVNATQKSNRTEIPWRDFVLDSTPVPTPGANADPNFVGLFEGAYYRDAGFYRPTYNSKMRGFGRPWGPVNLRAFADALHRLDLNHATALPTIESSPSSASVVKAAELSLSVFATGTGPFTYQWAFNGKFLAGQVDSTLSIRTAAEADAGIYTVEVSNARGRVVSAPATVTVITDTPTIVSPPSPQTLPLGATATFAVTATGTPAPTFQWEKNGVAIVGATDATLTLAAIRPSDAGNYSVTVSNSAGTTTSAAAALTIIGVVVFDTQPVWQTVEVGGTAIFHVSASVTPGPAAYQWYKNGVPIAGAIGATLTLPNVQKTDGGTYALVVGNGIDFATSADALLTVGSLAPPVITTQPRSLGAVAGAPISLAIIAPRTSGYQWFKDGAAIAGATGSTLTVPRIGPTDAGLYDILVTGAGGKTLSAPIVVGLLPETGQRTLGAVTTRAEWQGIVHPKGNVYDQFLLAGSAGTFTAATGRVARMSFLDEHESIVQVEMSGSGAITVVLDNASGPMDPSLYNQSGILYMKGKATIVLAGADATTHFTIYSVGTATNPGVTRGDVEYSGWADVAAAGIVSTNGGLGGIHQGNVNYDASVGFTGLYAPTVTSVADQPVVIHDIAASADATPYLYFSPTAQVQVKIAGGSLAQPNADSLTGSGLSQVQMGAGQDSCGRAAPAATIQTRLVEDNGTDVTASIVTGP